MQFKTKYILYLCISSRQSECMLRVGKEASTKVVKFMTSGLVFQDWFFSSYSEIALLKKFSFYSLTSGRLTNCQDMDEHGGHTRL